MKRYLLDTDSFSFLSQSHPEVIKNLVRISLTDEIFISFVTVGEWEYGFHFARSQRAKDEIRNAGDGAFDRLSGVIQSSQDINNAYGQIRADLRRAGTLIPQNDIWIAATALAIGGTLVTHDNHFQNVQNLAITDWTVS